GRRGRGRGRRRFGRRRGRLAFFGRRRIPVDDRWRRRFARRRGTLVDRLAGEQCLHLVAEVAEIQVAAGGVEAGGVIGFVGGGRHIVEGEFDRRLESRRLVDRLGSNGLRRNGFRCNGLRFHRLQCDGCGRNRLRRRGGRRRDGCFDGGCLDAGGTRGLRAIVAARAWRQHVRVAAELGGQVAHPARGVPTL